VPSSDTASIYAPSSPAVDCAMVEHQTGQLHCEGESARFGVIQDARYQVPDWVGVEHGTRELLQGVRRYALSPRHHPEQRPRRVARRHLTRTCQRLFQPDRIIAFPLLYGTECRRFESCRPRPFVKFASLTQGRSRDLPSPPAEPSGAPPHRGVRFAPSWLYRWRDRGC